MLLWNMGSVTSRGERFCDHHIFCKLLSTILANLAIDLSVPLFVSSSPSMNFLRISQNRRPNWNCWPCLINQEQQSARFWDLQSCDSAVCLQILCFTFSSHIGIAIFFAEFSRMQNRWNVFEARRCRHPNILRILLPRSTDPHQGVEILGRYPILLMSTRFLRITCQEGPESTINRVFRGHV